MSEHIWIELTTLDDLPERVWMCNAHPGEEKREIADPAWLAQKPAADRRDYERMGVQVVEQSPKLLRLADEAATTIAETPTLPFTKELAGDLAAGSTLGVPSMLTADEGDEPMARNVLARIHIETADGRLLEIIDIEPEDDIEDPRWPGAIGSDIRNLIRSLKANTPDPPEGSQP